MGKPSARLQNGPATRQPEREVHQGTLTMYKPLDALGLYYLRAPRYIAALYKIKGIKANLKKAQEYLEQLTDIDATTAVTESRAIDTKSREITSEDELKEDLAYAKSRLLAYTQKLQDNGTSALLNPPPGKEDVLKMIIELAKDAEQLRIDAVSTTGRLCASGQRRASDISVETRPQKKRYPKLMSRVDRQRITRLEIPNASKDIGDADPAGIEPQHDVLVTA